MNYYSFNINDYLSDTAHLEPMEDLAYRRLLDLYYQTEMPLPDDIAILAKRIRLRGQEDAIVTVLNEFFIHYGDSYRHTRCDAELGELYQKSAKAKASAQARWAKEKAKKQGQVKTNSVAEPDFRQPENAAAEPAQNECDTPEMPEPCALNANALPTHSECNATQYPLTQYTTTTARACSMFCDDLENATPTVAEPDFRQPENAAAEPNFDHFAMHPDWQPDDVDTVNALLRRVKLPSWGTGLIMDAALDFIAYWRKRPEVLNTASEWDNDFVRSVVKFRAKHGHNYDKATWELKPIPTPATTAIATQTAPNAPSKTKQSVMILQAVREKVVSGSLKTTLPPQISLVLVDGLMDLLGNNLKFPPAADTWDFTLNAWANEFARYGLGDDDVARVQTAFQTAKAKATHPDNHERRFPDVADVLACLPMKIVPKQLERKLSPEEWAEKAANGRNKAAELKKIIGKNRIQAA